MCIRDRLCTDADRAIRGLRLLRQLLKPRRTVIAIEDNKERAVSLLTDKLKQQDEVELVVLPTRDVYKRQSCSSPAYNHRAKTAYR